MGQHEPHYQENGETNLVTVAEIERKYPDQWVLLEIVRDDKDYRSVVGRLLAHSPDRAALDGPYQRFRVDHPTARVFELFTGDVVPEGIVVIL